jgi:hypothetical protein
MYDYENTPRIANALIAGAFGGLWGVGNIYIKKFIYK